MKECFRVCRLQESYDMKKRNCFHHQMQKLFIVSPGTFELRCFRRRVIVSKVRLQSTRAQILNIRFWREVQKNVKLKRFEHWRLLIQITQKMESRVKMWGTTKSSSPQSLCLHHIILIGWYLPFIFADIEAANCWGLFSASGIFWLEARLWILSDNFWALWCISLMDLSISSSSSTSSCSCSFSST